MFNFHKHVFTKDGNTLWCTCGKTKKIITCHQWVELSTNEITRVATEGILRHTLLNQQCSICGKFRQVNLTTGEVT
jgi:hypothetical protein